MKRSPLVLAVLFISMLTPALAQSKIYAANGKIPPLPQLNLMLEDTIRRFDKAVKANNFDALVAWSSTPTRDRFKSGAAFGEPFQPFVQARADLSVLVTAPRSYPKVTLQKPKLKEGKTRPNPSGVGELLDIEARYNLKSTITLNLQYLSEKGLWRLVTLRIRSTPRS